MITRKKIWNRIDMPVYSISSQANDENNLHIITYAQAVSMKPKQMICAIYKPSKTAQLVRANPHFVLQLLHQSQYNLIKLLGKQSGFDIDKISKLNHKKLLIKWKDFWVLKDCLGAMEMKAEPLIIHNTQPDHDLYLCTIISHANFNNGDPLTLNDLRKRKLIRI